MKRTLINGKWELMLPDHRADRPEWDINKGGWEVERINAMMGCIGEGDLVLDIGTEEGDISALLASKSKNIIMFEPNPKVWPNIKAIFDDQYNNLPMPVAIFIGFASSKTDLKGKQETEIMSIGGKDWPPCAYGELIGDHGFKELADSGDIPEIRIDDFMDRIDQRIAMITIDVEGSEFEVLKGARETILRDKPEIFVSVHPTFMADYFQQKYPDLRDYICELGYKERYLTYDHELHIHFEPISLYL